MTEKRKEQNRKYYFANAERWKLYRQARIERTAEAVKRNLNERRKKDRENIQEG